MSETATLEAPEGADHYSNAEVEAIARLCLGDLPIRVEPGDWWSYTPASGVISYPPLFVDAWPPARVVGALIHEVAEALFSGPESFQSFVSFIQSAAESGCRPASAALLLNAVNDLRVNRQYMEQFPGSRRFLGAVYTAGSLLERPDDVPSENRPVGGLPHHLYLDALTRRWASRIWSDTPRAERLPGLVESAVRRTMPAVLRAAEVATLEETARIVAADVLSTYTRLVAASLEMLENPQADGADRYLEDTPRQESSTLDEGGEGSEYAEDSGGGEEAEGGDLPPGGKATLTSPEGIVLTGESEEKPAEGTTTGSKTTPKSVERTERTGYWDSGTIFRIRRRSSTGPDYEQFDYVAAARRLEPHIRAALDGRDGQLGLTQILNLRRFGTIDPWRRPRRRLRGDSGEIDPDHPESLLVDPAVAFLRNAARKRDDSQKDFANAILLDISGSVVQKGYSSRKFDQLVDTMVVFCELHERLKLPYELIPFSDDPSVIRGFGEVVFAHQHVDPASAYTIKDLSSLVRETYLMEHGETKEAVALRRALLDVMSQRGLKTLLIVTDGISSDRPALTRMLTEIEERNFGLPAGQRIRVLAFGVGLAEAEFKASYEPEMDDQPLRCSAGFLVPNIEALPGIVCRAIEDRIRNA